MQNEINNIVQHLFHKSELKEVPDHELSAFVDQYPYSPVGQYMLAQRKHNTGVITAEEKETTALYFNNHLWLQWLLTTQQYQADGRQERIAHSFIHHTEASAGTDLSVAADTSDATPATEEIYADAEISIEAANDIEIIHEQSAEMEADLVIKEEKAEHINCIPPSEESGDGGAVSREQYLSAAWTVETPADIQAEPAEAAAPSEEAIAHQEPAPEEERPIAFQSYHTIDYFASQGIKLQAAELGADKLGQQLKSFTDWLRSMKKLASAGGAQTESSPDDDSRRIQVSRIAEKSVQEKEVLTEAMAEVWAKQGNIEKAIDIYAKLSLQNPHKNAYFAAKIDQLKVS